jgi:hypothetical protein
MCNGKHNVKQFLPVNKPAGNRRDYLPPNEEAGLEDCTCQTRNNRTLLFVCQQHSDIEIIPDRPRSPEDGTLESSVPEDSRAS